jgi:acetylglutamate kinase
LHEKIRHSIIPQNNIRRHKYQAQLIRELGPEKPMIGMLAKTSVGHSLTLQAIGFPLFRETRNSTSPLSSPCLLPQVDLNGIYAILAGFFPHFLRTNLKILQKPPEPNHFSPSQSRVAAPALLVLLTENPPRFVGLNMKAPLEAIAKADTLIEAMGWIRRFRGKTTVIKLGGSLMNNPDAMRHTLLDIIFMETVGMRPVVVHGGGPSINKAMEAAAIEPVWIKGRRYTDPKTLEIVERVLGYETNEYIANEIERLGGRAMNLNFRTTNVLFGEKLSLDEDGTPLDLGFVGHVTRVDRQTIESLTYTEQIPVIPSMCIDENGQKYNVNADTAAMAVAEALGAEKLIFISDVNGVRRDKDDPESVLHSLTAQEARQLIQDGVIAGGMIPKVEACLATLNRGVGKVHIIDGQLRHSLLLEIYTTAGVGTEIVPSRNAASTRITQN